MLAEHRIDHLLIGAKYAFRVEICGVEFSFYGRYYGMHEERYDINADWLTLLVEPDKLVSAIRVKDKPKG